MIRPRSDKAILLPLQLSVSKAIPLLLKLEGEGEYAEGIRSYSRAEILIAGEKLNLFAPDVD